MTQERIIACAKELSKITIKRHKEKLLGKEKMSKFIKNNIAEEITKKEYDAILHLYSRYLAKEGYEIIKDIYHFDIIDYNIDEYKIYCDDK